MMNINQREEGATLVETAIVLPLLLFVVISIMELGLAFRDYLTVDFAAKEGARVGALAGNDIDADCDIIQSVVEGYGASDFANLEGITIFEVLPSGAANVSTQNTWTFNNDGANDPANCGHWGQTAPNAWVSTNRVVTVGGGVDLSIIGVRIVTRHHWVTGFPPWTGQLEIDRTAVQRLEPEAFA